MMARGLTADQALNITESIIERHIKREGYELGPLRMADVRNRIRYLVENWETITKRPAAIAVEDWPDIAEEAIAQSFACEAARAIQWNIRLAVLIAHHVLEEVNAHTEAAALLEAAKRMGDFSN